MDNIRPGLVTLIKTLVTDDPADVHRFYQCLPDIDGVIIPDMAPPPPNQHNVWIGHKLAEGDWNAVVHNFCNIEPKDVETLSDLTEIILMELSQLCGQFMLKEPLSSVYSKGTEVILTRKSKIHSLFWCQLGVSLVICEVTSAQWSSALNIIRTMTTELELDWMSIQPPGIIQFADIDRGMVTLFVLETLVKTKQCQKIVEYLKQWDCLVGLESDLSSMKRDVIMLGVLECLAVTNVDIDTLYIMIRINEVMMVTMSQEKDLNMRRRHEVMSNITFIMMLNNNLPGARLYKRYQDVRSLRHEIE